MQQFKNNNFNASSKNCKKDDYYDYYGMWKEFAQYVKKPYCLLYNDEHLKLENRNAFYAI